MQIPSKKSASERLPQYIIFSLLLLFAAWLRFGLLNASLPYIYDPDEAHFVNIAYRMLANGDPNPHWFGHPGSFTLYVMAVLYGLYAVLGLSVGWFTSLQDVGRQFWYDPSVFYLIGRFSIVLFGLGSIALLYTLTRQLAGRWVSLLAAALLALAPMHIEYSALIRTDIQQTFFLLGVALFSLRLAKGGKRRDALYAGLMLGLAVAIKYPSVIGVVMIVAGSLAATRQQRQPWGSAVSSLLWAAVAALLACFAASPFLFFDFTQVLSDVLGEARSVHLSAGNPGFFSAIWFYLGTQVGRMLGSVGIALALVGSVWLVYLRPAAASVLLGFFVAYLSFIASMSLMWARWVIPLLPLACMAAALGAGALWAVVKRWWPGRVGAYLVLVIVTTQLGMDVMRAERSRAALLAPVPATIAREWALQNIPKNSNVLVERYSPQFESAHYSQYEVGYDGHISPVKNATSKYRIPRGVYGALQDAGELASFKIDYVLLGNDFDRRAAEPERYGESLARYQALLGSWTLVYETKSTNIIERGGVVRILRAPTAEWPGKAKPLAKP